MSWILEFLGVLLSPAVIPITLALTSAHASPLYMTLAPPLGTLCALTSWLTLTKTLYGAVNITTTFENWPMFTGCTVGLFVPLVLWLAMWPLHRRQPYDWDRLFLMQAAQPRPGDRAYEPGDVGDLGAEWCPAGLARAARNAKIVSAVMCLIFLVIIPFSLYGAGYVFSRKFFTGWTVVVFIWSWLAAAVIWCLPIWEARKSFAAVVRGIVGAKSASNSDSSELGAAEEKDLSNVSDREIAP